MLDLELRSFCINLWEFIVSIEVLFGQQFFLVKLQIAKLQLNSIY